MIAICVRVFQLKDLNEQELKSEIDSYTVKFELESMINTKSKHLSGGMKRKLSVAIALIGKSKVRTRLAVTSAVSVRQPFVIHNDLSILLFARRWF